MTQMAAIDQSRSELACFNPATSELLGRVENTSAEKVAQLVASARAVQGVLAKKSFAERRELLSALLDHVLEHADELCDVIVRDAGKTPENAMLGEIWPICEKLRWTIENGERYLKPEPVSAGPLVHKKARIEFLPMGVIGVITPWNFPVQNVLGPAAPALMAGNAVVVKVSEWTSYSAARIQRIFDDSLDRCGLPRDLVQIVTGDGQTGAALFTAGVDKVVFTGSLATGKKIIAQSAETVTPLVLELGGKDPMIVCDDAALDQALHSALAGTMICSGQMCLAAERIFVQQPVYQQFVQMVVDAVSKLRQGAPTVPGRIDVGAVTMPSQLEIISALVDDAIERGATLHCGGKIARDDKGGDFFEPTVLSDITPEMRIAREETFGPVITLASFADDEQAVALANNTRYGLGSTVFSKNHRRADQLGQRIIAGSTCVNDFGLAYMAQALPFGGVRGSGYGRLNGREGLRACCHTKSVLSDRFPFHRPTRLFPVKPHDYRRARATIRLIYSKGISRRLDAGIELLRSFFG
jgi:acyl-CoA reductase-like NAD-dependent aldehyde dehydrogenase